MNSENLVLLRTVEPTEHRRKGGELAEGLVTEINPLWYVQLVIFQRKIWCWNIRASLAVTTICQDNGVLILLH